jgi:phosphoserine aminotransferase
LSVPDNYAIVFVQGGASLQFAMVPMYFKQEGKVFSYIHTGEWSTKAIKEGKLLGEVKILASSEDHNFNYIPDLKNIKIPENSAYFHITSNETISGIQYQTFPDSGNVPMISDMSSDFMSRPIDVSKFGLIFAGAQKNVGPAGIVPVIIRKDLLDKEKKVPSMMNYAIHVENNSLYNTPNCFGIYMIGLVMKYVKKFGGLKKMEEFNRAKAKLIYDTIDAGSFYKGTAEKNSRSLMNVTFTLPKPDFDKEFNSEAEKLGLIGLKGHRSVGGFRASLYNAQTMENVKKLVEFMKDFETKHK